MLLPLSFILVSPFACWCVGSLSYFFYCVTFKTNKVKAKNVDSLEAKKKTIRFALSKQGHNNTTIATITTTNNNNYYYNNNNNNNNNKKMKNSPFISKLDYSAHTQYNTLEINSNPSTLWAFSVFCVLSITILSWLSVTHIFFVCFCVWCWEENHFLSCLMRIKKKLQRNAWI